MNLKQYKIALWSFVLLNLLFTPFVTLFLIPFSLVDKLLGVPNIDYEGYVKDVFSGVGDGLVSGDFFRGELPPGTPDLLSVLDKLQDDVRKGLMFYNRVKYAVVGFVNSVDLFYLKYPVVIVINEGVFFALSFLVANMFFEPDKKGEKIWSQQF